ncbi:hypothetical protein Daus18300_014471 [Diaporthe australafricana]|uniref:Uncharacterized protein n=1 Tax=Diaporthe australafricana TaxID=127596 RepID=A0ABR3VV41_9PEZI
MDPKECIINPIVLMHLSQAGAETKDDEGGHQRHEDVNNNPIQGRKGGRIDEVGSHAFGRLRCGDLREVLSRGQGVRKPEASHLIYFGQPVKSADDAEAEVKLAETE